MRRRLTAGLVVVVVVVLVVAGVAMTLAVRSFLYSLVDRELLTTATSLTSEHSLRPDGLRAGTVVVETDAEGQLTGSPLLVRGREESAHDSDDGATPTPAELTSSDVDQLTSMSTSIQTVTLEHLGRYRAVQLSTPSGDQVTVALPLVQLDETFGRLLLVEGLTLAAAVLVVSVVAGWLIRHDLLPLDRVARTARQVATLPLSSGTPSLKERVPPGPTGTEIGDVTEAMNEMLDHLQSSLQNRAETERQLRQLVADASHELRTPLASIRGYAELYRRGDVDEADRRTAMARIESEAERMGSLVDDLLLLARLDQGRPLEHSDVDLARLVVDAATDMGVMSPDHPVTIDLSSNQVTVLGDENRLRQVLANLLSNAVQHTPVGTRVTVSVREDADRARLEVTDNGPGIAPEFLPHVFERFTRADESRARTLGGSGLGLSIVHAVVDALDGSVTVQSEPGRTTFTVDLPRAPTTTG